MELRQLAALEAVLTTGSFAAAARARHVAQPALWAQVKALEREVGVALFERQGRGVRPTAAATALRPHVQRLLEGARELGDLAQALRLGRALPVRLGCAHYSLPHFVAGVFAKLRAEAPHVPTPVVVPVTSSSGPDALSRGDLDLAVLPFVERLPFEGQVLYPMWVSVLGPNVGRGLFEVARLADRPIATLPPDTGVGMLLAEVCRRAKVRPNIVLETRDVGTLRAFALKGLATSIVVSEALGPQDAARTARLGLGGRALETELWLHWRSAHALSPMAERLREALVAAARSRRPRSGSARFWPLPAAAQSSSRNSSLYV